MTYAELEALADFGGEGEEFVAANVEALDAGEMANLGPHRREHIVGQIELLRGRERRGERGERREEARGKEIEKNKREEKRREDARD